MKRLFSIVISVVLLAQIAFSYEVVSNSYGEDIVLQDSGIWISKEKLDQVEEFSKKVDVEILNINSKKNRFRTMTFKVTNNTRDDLTFLKFGVKYKFEDEYSLRKIITVKNLKAGENIEVQRQINVQDIEGRDVILEIKDYNF